MSAASLSTLVFVTMAGVDYLWARYTLHVQAGNRGRAAALSGVLTVLSYGVILAYTGAPILVLPAAAGAALGTWLGIDPKLPPPGDGVAPT